MAEARYLAVMVVNLLPPPDCLLPWLLMCLHIIGTSIGAHLPPWPVPLPSPLVRLPSGLASAAGGGLGGGGGGLSSLSAEGLGGGAATDSGLGGTFESSDARPVVSSPGPGGGGGESAAGDKSSVALPVPSDASRAEEGSLGGGGDVPVSPSKPDEGCGGGDESLKMPGEGGVSGAGRAASAGAGGEASADRAAEVVSPGAGGLVVPSPDGAAAGSARVESSVPGGAGGVVSDPVHAQDVMQICRMLEISRDLA